MPYYLTVMRDGHEILNRKLFDDFGSAIEYTAQYYRAKLPEPVRSVMPFTTEVVNERFARAYAYLERPEAVAKDRPHHERSYAIAVKRSNAFAYDASYLFSIESEFGIAEAESMRARFEDEE